MVVSGTNGEQLQPARVCLPVWEMICKTAQTVSFVSLGLYRDIQNRKRPEIIKQKWRYGSQEFTGRRRGRGAGPHPPALD